MRHAGQVPRRRYRPGVDLSIVGFGGMVAVGMRQDGLNRLVAESCEGGINYFDVAPFYGDGEAEEKLGFALAPYREKVFLAGKTLERGAEGARQDLERSLRRLQADRLDLYQFHAVTSIGEVEEIFGPGGAAESFVEARAQGKARFLGFSAHSVEAAMAMIDRFAFDSILFPVNFACYARGNFGPQVMEKARLKDVSRLAVKAMAHRHWHRGEERSHPKCWYKPIEDMSLARQALRFTLSEDLTSALPPGDEELFRLAVELACAFTPLSAEERRELLDGCRNLRSLFK